MRVAARAVLGGLAILVGSGVLVAAGVRPVAAQQLAAAEIARLERGEIVTRTWKIKGTSIGTGWASGRIDASPEQVFSVIADVGRYKEYMNRVVESRVTRREGNGRYDFRYKIDMPWPLSDLSFVTRNTHQIDAKRRVYRRSWTLRSGSFTRNEGYWLVRPWRGGRASLVTYSSALEPKSVIPQFVINYVTRKALPRSVANIRDRVAQLRRAGRLPSGAGL